MICVQLGNRVAGCQAFRGSSQHHKGPIWRLRLLPFDLLALVLVFPENEPFCHDVHLCCKKLQSDLLSCAICAARVGAVSYEGGTLLVIASSMQQPGS